MNTAAAALVAGVEPAVAGWILREVDRLVTAWGRLSPEEAAVVRADAAAVADGAARRARDELAALLALDPAEQRATPLEVVRRTIPEVTAVLERAGIPAVVRDAFAEEAWPDDRYGLTPASLRDLDPDLAAVHLAWGYAKAQALRTRDEGGDT